MDRRIEVEESLAETGKVEFTIPLNDFQSTGFSIPEEIAEDLLNALVGYFHGGHDIFTLIEYHEEDGRAEGFDQGYSEGYEDAEYELGKMED